MRPFAFPGTYEDDAGYEPLTWRIGPSDRTGWQGRYEIRTRVRDVELWGGDFDCLEPVDAATAARARLALASFGDLTECVLSGDLPCVVDIGSERQPTTVGFRLDLRASSARPPVKNLRLATALAGTTHEVTDYWFEDATLRLDEALRPARLVCCVTCLYSDYSPGGHGLMGMSCHREAKEQYLAVRSKLDYWWVPLTEEVPETYLCEEYQRRVPGTGYRG